MATTSIACTRTLASALAMAAALAALTACGPKDAGPAAPPGPPAGALAAGAATPTGKPGAAAEGLRVEGRVADITRPPKPGSVPYKDAIVAIHLTDVQSRDTGVPRQVVAYAWGMRNNQLSPAARIQKGERLSVTLKPWDTVEDEVGSYNRIELTDPATMALTPYWVERP